MTRKIPKNLEECLEQLDIANKNNKELIHWLKLPDKEASGIVHFSSGMWMRNNWGLWDIKSPLNKYFNSIGISHADDMSGIISASFHRRMNGKPILLEQQVKFYQDFWKKQGYMDGIPK